MKKAETLQEIQQVTEPAPLKGQDLEVFYVPADAARDSTLPPSGILRRYLETTPQLHLLFASHPGGGKSTELHRLMRESGQDYWFVYLSAKDALDLAELTHVDLILALTEKLYETGRTEKLIKDRRVIEPVRGWLREVVRETQVAREEDLEVEAGAGLDGLLAQVVGLQAKLRSAFRLSHETGETVRQVLRPRIAELRQHCNDVITEITTHLNERSPRRRLVLIVDDTNALDVPVARELFVSHTGLLADLQTSLVYTVPLFLVHSPDRAQLKRYFDILTLPMIKTHAPQGERFDAGWQVLRQIVARRMEVENLIELAALDLAIDKTGGVVRDLLKVIRLAGWVAEFEKASRISVQAVRYSLDQLKTEYYQSVRGTGNVSSEVMYQKMKELAKAPQGKVEPDDTLQLLLYTQAVIEYNGRGWYDLHPLMRENLQEMGYLDGVAR
jgi:hypothetical protein